MLGKCSTTSHMPSLLKFLIHLESGFSVFISHWLCAWFSKWESRLIARFLVLEIRVGEGGCSAQEEVLLIPRKNRLLKEKRGIQRKSGTESC